MRPWMRSLQTAAPSGPAGAVGLSGRLRWRFSTMRLALAVMFLAAFALAVLAVGTGSGAALLVATVLGADVQPQQQAGDGDGADEPAGGESQSLAQKEIEHDAGDRASR